MAIAHWSGRRLVGTWIAGIAGEIVLLALPVAFVVVTNTASGASHWESDGGPFIDTRPRSEARITRRAEFEAREARAARSAARADAAAEVEKAMAEARLARASAELKAAEAVEERIAAVRAAEAAEARAQFASRTVYKEIEIG